MSSNAARDVQGRSAAWEQHLYRDRCFGNEGLKKLRGKPVFADVRAHRLVAFSRGDHFHRKAETRRDAGSTEAERPHRN